jgi:hypothetical protein
MLEHMDSGMAASGIDSRKAGMAALSVLQQPLGPFACPEHAAEVEKATCVVIVNTYFNDRRVIKTAKVRETRVQAMKKRQQGKDTKSK